MGNMNYEVGLNRRDAETQKLLRIEVNVAY